jgi:hypothetical protein
MKPTTSDPELKSALDALRDGIAAAAPASKLTQLQAQVDAIDLKLASKHIGDAPAPALIEQLKSNEDVSRLLRDKKGILQLLSDQKEDGSS